MSAFEKWFDENSERLANNLHNACDEAWNAALEQQWQPIETAPTNTRIMMFGDSLNGAECEIGWIYEDNGIRYCSHGGFIPTHWQPLPQPPKP